MGRSERALWQLVRERLKPYAADLERVENAIGYGTPDVHYCLTYRGHTGEGWLELKEIEAWPKDAARVVRVEHYTPQQRVWARKRWLRGGKVYMLLRVKETQHIMLIDGPLAAAYVGISANRAILLGIGETSGQGAFPTQGQLLKLAMPRPLVATQASHAGSTRLVPQPG